MEKPPDLIYLDYHSATPCDPRVVEVMLPYFTKGFGNPSSGVHALGRLAAEAVEEAREQVAALIGGRRKEIIFTAGATESNNLAIWGVANALEFVDDRPCAGRTRIVTSAIEHKSVLNVCRALERRGFDIVVLPVDRQGLVSTQAAEAAIDPNTLLVSIQAASNEIGTIQQVSRIAALAHEQGALMHCDAAQAVGKIPVDVAEWDVDLLSISAHKLYGPKGVGALYIKDGPFAYPLAPLILGGGQEWGLRSGTLNVPGIVGFGTACSICQIELLDEGQQVAQLRDLLEKALLEAIPGLRRNGAIDQRLPNNSSLTFPDVDSEALIANLPAVALSAGSACTSGAPEPSHVLLAIGLSREEAYRTLRIGLGRFSTVDEIDAAADAIVTAAKRLQSDTVATQRVPA